MKDQTNLVIYHAGCSDGFGAAYAAWKLLGNKSEYFYAKHGFGPPDVKGKHVVIADFSYDRETTLKMIDDAASLVILDHHKSAAERLVGIPNLHFDNNHSGCILSWNYFHPDKEPPKFLRYIEDRDLWRFSLPYSKEFSSAFDMVPFEFSDFDDFIDDSVIDDAITRGKYILAYEKTVINKICEYAAKRTWRGKRALVVNSSHAMSEIGGKLSPDCDFAVIWYFDHESQQTKVSFRSFYDEIDVSAIAQEYGGGGHAKAAGCQLPKNIHIEDIFDKS
jgi:oligoribonuclease NrnB/cAMP/cGMP phosphodiesterase (DHH superfamily)